MFRDGIDLPKEKFNILFDDGGLGDNICRMSAIKYLLNTQPHLDITTWVPDYFKDFALNLLPNVNIKSFTEAKVGYTDGIAGRKTSDGVHTSMATHLVDNAFNILVDQSVAIEHKNYLKLNIKPISISKFNLPKKYVVVTTGFTAEVREMLPKVINEVTSYCISKGYKVVFLGNKQTPNGAGFIIKGSFSNDIDFSKGINLVNKTSLLEAGKILANARAVCGLDNGLLHVAATTDIPIVYGFTSVLPEHRLPYRNNILGFNCYPVTPKLNCFGCQSNWAHVYNNNFTKCFYKENGYDNEIKCVKLLTSDLYIKQLENIL